MARRLWKAAGPSNSRLHTPSSHTETIDLSGHGDRGYLNWLDNTLRRGQVKIWLHEARDLELSWKGGNLDESEENQTERFRE